MCIRILAHVFDQSLKKNNDDQSAVAPIFAEAPLKACVHRKRRRHFTVKESMASDEFQVSVEHLEHVEFGLALS